jgi:hypothetical protein
MICSSLPQVWAQLAKPITLNEGDKAKMRSAGIISLTALLGVAFLPLINIGIANGSRVCCEGDWWLKSTREAKDAYIVGLMRGISSGFHKGCDAAALDAARSAVSRLSESELLTQCLKEAPQFRQSSTFYVKLTTALYTHFPSDRRYLVQEMLSAIARSQIEKPTAEQLHDMLNHPSAKK